MNQVFVMAFNLAAAAPVSQDPVRVTLIAVTIADSDGNRLGEFLKARRGLVSPEDADVPAGGRRRVPGLRRAELAELAGVSTPYLMRLEQGRDRRPSPQVLDALARALRLDADATAHLRALAAGPEDLARIKSTTVAPGIQQLLDGWSGAAAFVRDRRFDVLASNALARALSPFYVPGRNLVRDTFLDPAARAFFADWPTIAAQAVAGLRQEAGAATSDPALTTLVDELSGDPDFRALWARHDVRAVRGDCKRVVHPTAGPMTLTRQLLSLPDTDGHVLLAYQAEPGSSAASALASLVPAARTAI
jgi:transcriptional regulator with XRE-family HTH domain